MLRIVGGKYKHRLLNQPSMETTRCTKDIAREGLFNSLGDISNSNFLDLFGGSGAVGIEAYSRGASKVYINDKDKLAKNIILNNLKKLDIHDINVSNLSDLDLIKKLSEEHIYFDYIFLDPPYKMDIDLKYLNNLKELKLCDGRSIIILETDHVLNENDYESFRIKQLKYGKTYMNILRSK